MVKKKHPARHLSLAMELPIDLTSQFVERIMSLSPSIKADYLKEHVLSKYVSSETDPAPLRRERALLKWLATELVNEQTSERLAGTEDSFLIFRDTTYEEFTDFCRSMICDIVGDTPPLEALIGSFSGGASTSRSRTVSQPANKYVGKAHVTARALDIWSEISSEMPGWQGWLHADGIMSVDIVPGNVFFTVPKKTDIDRVACKEPDLNMFIQKGIGKHFRRCLRRIGINLNDQSINRSLAHEGSVHGRLATLDLSSASDSVTTELVFQLLPVTWYTLLDAVRCQVTIIDGEEHRNHMFSSMGNGFTFELESLLFYVLARATAYFTGTRGVVSVYGDDIICPADMSADLTWVLKYFGFSVNLEKSFTEGPIRESCGGHYWNGRDITPFYLRKPIARLDDLIDVANKLRQWGKFEESCLIDLEVEEIWLWLKSHIPDSLWGGMDLAFKYQLVSFDTPIARLYEETDRRIHGIGAYFHWLNATWDRTNVSDGMSTSVDTRPQGQFRMKRVRTSAVPRLSHLFYHEIGRMGSCPDTWRDKPS